MSASHLRREAAPIGDDEWKAIEEEARRILELRLAGRKVVPLEGPHGWRYAAVPTGALNPIEAPSSDVRASLRRVQPLVELRAAFSLSMDVLDSISRGEQAPNLDPVRAAAEVMAAAEDGAIFNGYPSAAITGMIEASRQEPVVVTRPEAWAEGLARGVEQLRQEGIPGPFRLVVSPRAHAEIGGGSDEGYPLRKQILQLLGSDPAALVEAGVLEHAVVMSAAEGHYELTVGQDLAIGFAFQQADHVELFVLETFTFRVLEPNAAVLLRRE